MDKNLFYPFESELDWNMAEWLVDDGPSQSANNQLLKILHVSKVLFLFSFLLIFLNLLQSKEDSGLSFHNMENLKRKISNLPKQGEWHTYTITPSEDPTVQHQIYYQNPIDVIKSLWSNPTYADQMVFSPQKLWTSSDKTSRLYNEMWTGNWWWKIQVFILFKAYIIDLLNYFNIKQDKLPKGATVAPVIISSDKTQLTEFSGNKQAYPVYLTIGNIPG